MHDEFDIIFVLLLGFFVAIIILLVILIRVGQPHDRTKPCRAVVRMGRSVRRANCVQCCADNE